MAVEYKKIIATKSVSIASSGWMATYKPPYSLAYGQAYEIESTTATESITNGYAIDYATALSNPKCPPIIRIKAIRIG